MLSCQKWAPLFAARYILQRTHARAMTKQRAHARAMAQQRHLMTLLCGQRCSRCPRCAGSARSATGRPTRPACETPDQHHRGLRAGRHCAARLLRCLLRPRAHTAAAQGAAATAGRDSERQVVRGAAGRGERAGGCTRAAADHRRHGRPRVATERARVQRRVPDAARGGRGRAGRGARCRGSAFSGGAKRGTSLRRSGLMQACRRWTRAAL